MSDQFTLILSDDLCRDIEKAEESNKTNKNELLRKALQLYLIALEAKNRGLKLGLVDPTTEIMQTEFTRL